MNNTTKRQIADEFKNCIKNSLKRIKNSDGDYRPFHRRLLNEEILKFSKFERSFSTSFGQRVVEKISNIIVLSIPNTSNVENQKKTKIQISKDCLSKIEEHLINLRDNTLNRKPNWILDTKDIESNKSEIELRVISDLYFKRNNIDYFFSLKTVKPNIDQVAEAKRDMLKLFANNPNSKMYFAIPYNPYGENKNEYAHTPPFQIFDMINDSCVLIGKDYKICSIRHCNKKN